MVLTNPSTLIGSETNLAVCAQISIDDSELILGVVWLNNKTQDKWIEVLPEKISIWGYSEEMYGKEKEKIEQLKVYSANEYLKTVRKQQAWQRVFYGLSQGLESMNAGKSTAYFNTYGGPSGVIETYDYGAKAEAEARMRAETQEMSRQQLQSYTDISQILLKRNTLFPQRAIKGAVITKIDYSCEYKKFVVIFPVGVDTYSFTFVVSR